MEGKDVFLKWTERMSVNSVEIDNQHRMLIGYLNEMYQSFNDNEHKEKVGPIIEKLKEYTQYHFDTEEKYFAKFGYDGAENHIAEHDQFRLKVQEFVEKEMKYRNALTYEVMNFLRSWLYNHIMVTDKKYMDCFSKNGVM
jgi:hemerythrin-like metal-binding protein